MTRAGGRREGVNTGVGKQGAHKKAAKAGRLRSNTAQSASLKWSKSLPSKYNALNLTLNTTK